MEKYIRTYIVLALLTANAASAKDIFIAPTGSDSAQGTITAPLASINKATSIAEAGDIIYLAGGTYPLTKPQRIDANADYRNPIIVKAQDDQDVILDASAITQDAAITLSGSGVEMRGVHILGAGHVAVSIPQGDHIVMSGNVIAGSAKEALMIGGADLGRIYVKGNEFTDSGDADNAVIISQAEYITFDNNYIHHNAGAGLFVNGVADGEISQNKLHDNANANLRLGDVSALDVISNEIYNRERTTSRAATCNTCSDGVVMSTSADVDGELMFRDNVVYNVDEAIAVRDANYPLANAMFENNVFFNTNDAILGIDSPKVGQHNMMFSRNMFVPEAGAFMASDASLQGAAFENNCWSDGQSLPVQASGNGNVQTDISLQNNTLGPQIKNNLRGKDVACQDMDAGAMAFQALDVQPSTVALEGQPQTQMITQNSESNDVTIIEEVMVIDEPVQEVILSPAPVIEPEAPVLSAGLPSLDGFGSIMSFIQELVTSIVSALMESLFGMSAIAATPEAVDKPASDVATDIATSSSNASTDAPAMNDTPAISNVASPISANANVVQRPDEPDMQVALNDVSSDDMERNDVFDEAVSQSASSQSVNQSFGQPIEVAMARIDDAVEAQSEESQAFSDRVNQVNASALTPGRNSGEMTYLYQLQKANYSSLQQANADIMVIDPDDSGLTPQQVQTMKGQGKLTFAYTSIGEAEDYRGYWRNNNWTVNPPSFLLEENPDWPGNYTVEFWHPDWQRAMIDRIVSFVRQGYDGIYLDIVDGFQRSEVIDAYNTGGDVGKSGDIRNDMENFVIRISNAAKAVNPQFKIIPQNAISLLAKPNDIRLPNVRYLQAIDGIGKETTFYLGTNKTSWAESDVQYLRHAVNSGKFILAVDYVRGGANQEDFIKRCVKEGYIPFVGERALDNTGPEVNKIVPDLIE